MMKYKCEIMTNKNVCKGFCSHSPSCFPTCPSGYDQICCDWICSEGAHPTWSLEHQEWIL